MGLLFFYTSRNDLPPPPGETHLFPKDLPPLIPGPRFLPDSGDCSNYLCREGWATSIPGRTASSMKSYGPMQARCQAGRTRTRTSPRPPREQESSLTDQHCQRNSSEMRSRWYLPEIAVNVESRRLELVLVQELEEEVRVQQAAQEEEGVHCKDSANEYLEVDLFKLLRNYHSRTIVHPFSRSRH